MSMLTRSAVAPLVVLLVVGCATGEQDAVIDDVDPAAVEREGPVIVEGVEEEPTSVETEQPEEPPEVAGAEALVVSGAWSRMSPRRAGVGAVYLELENAASDDDALVAASVPADVAGWVELHETYMVEDEDEGDGGHGMGGDGDDAGAPMMAMREVESITIPAGGTTTLEPGGLHLMLMDIVEDLVPGETFELLLEFERADPMTVVVEVRAHS
jgi:periplasmic copper chaperone A